MIPKHLFDQVTLALKEKNHGAGYMFDNGSQVGILFHSPQNCHINDAMIIAATMLLNAVTSGETYRFVQTAEEYLQNVDLSDKKPT